jgi:hypothetical protein
MVVSVSGQLPVRSRENVKLETVGSFQARDLPQRGYRPQPRVLTRVLTRETLSHTICPERAEDLAAFSSAAVFCGNGLPCFAFSSALTGRITMGWLFPGLKPWAEGYSPFGALQFGHFEKPSTLNVSEDETAP